MMESGSEDFCEESDYPFQKLYRSIACVFIASKKNESSETFIGDFNIIDQKSRWCKSFDSLLSQYELEPK